jgi:hypothetical protein
MALYLFEFLEDPPPPARTIAGFAALYAIAWLCNAPAAVIASYALALLLAWAAFTRRSWRIVLRGGCAFALGLGAASFYIVPAAYEQRWVNIGQALSSGLSPAQNFLFTAIDDVEHTWFNWIASICAICLILLLGFSALLSRRFAPAEGAPEQKRSVFIALLLVGSAAAALMLRWTLPLWQLLPKLRFVQFPWRWMSIVALVSACFLAAVVERRRGWIALVVILVLTVPLAWFFVRNTWWDQDEMPTMAAAITSGTGFDGTDEYDPLGDDHLDLPATSPLTKVLPADTDDPVIPQARVQVLNWTAEERNVRVDSPVPARIALRLLNYPAWKVELNGRPQEPERLDDVNQMVVPVQAGTSEIRVKFARTADRRVADAISSISAIIGAVLFWMGRRPNTPGVGLKRRATSRV